MEFQNLVEEYTKMPLILTKKSSQNCLFMKKIWIFVLTFGVFGVIPSYLVRIEHILWENNEKIFFGPKIFFRPKKSKIWKIIFSKILRFWKISKSKFKKSQHFEKNQIFFINLIFWIENSSKIFFQNSKILIFLKIFGFF